MDKDIYSPIIILLGPPGSGKGTQAALLADRCNMTHLSPGALLRKLSKKDPKKLKPKVRKELKKMAAGNMVGHWLVYDLMFPKILKASKKGQGVIMDGAIRTLAQTKGYTKFFEENGLMGQVNVIWIGITKKETIDRLTKRRVCSACGENIPYNKRTKSLKKHTCGGKLVTRADDTNRKVLGQRIKVQGNKSQAPVLKALGKRGILTKVDGSGSIDEVEDRVLKVLIKQGWVKKKGRGYSC